MCDDCTYKFITLGSPCVALINLTCSYYRYCKLLTYDEHYAPDVAIAGPLNFMEKKGFVISSEIDTHRVAILPNFKTCVYDEERNKFCWCRR